MITTELYDGQGLGNQLWCYVTTRVIARDKKVAFGIQSPEKFKAFGLFSSFSFGEQVTGGSGPEGGPPTTLPDGITHYYCERDLRHPDNNVDIRMFDPALVAVPDNTKIDGVMQDEAYVRHRKEEIREWLRVREDKECFDYSDENTCVINFRGGEYVLNKRVFLPQSYWDTAVARMREHNPKMQFVVITDDVKTAKTFFPNFPVYHFSITKDYVVIKNAQYLILSNSSFACFPAWLNEKLKRCIAPKYWSQYNESDGYWGCSYNIMDGWEYLDRTGALFSSDTCREELTTYIAMHPEYYPPVKEKVEYTFVPGVLNASKKDMPSPSLPRKIVRYARWKIRANAQRVRAALKSLYSRMTFKNTRERAEYRTSIRIYDVFTFFNELELLELRLAILDPYVDYFVIVEANETFSGKSKPLYYEENKERFAQYAHKIIHHVTNDVPKDPDDLRTRFYASQQMSDLDTHIAVGALTSDNIAPGAVHWFKEFYQKESIRKALVGLNDTDICFISDVDEIWNPEVLIDYSKDDVFKLRQTVYAYYLNNRSNEPWAGTLVTKYKNIKESYLNHLRTPRKTPYTYLPNGGWHFTNQGGAEKIKQKIGAYGHQEHNTKEILSAVEQNIQQNKDFVGRAYTMKKDDSGLPEYIFSNRKKYKDYLLP